MQQRVRSSSSGWTNEDGIFCTVRVRAGHRRSWIAVLILAQAVFVSWCSRTLMLDAACLDHDMP